MRSALWGLSTALLFLLASCTSSPKTDSEMKSAKPDGTFKADVDFLAAHGEVIVLSDPDSGARIAIAPAYQGRVMTSTADGEAGLSLGWINYELIASGEILPHINPFGGEDRFWLGPEGGQYSLYFSPGTPFEFAHWQVPAALDTEPFETVTMDGRSVEFRRDMVLQNYAGTLLPMTVDRRIDLLTRDAAMQDLGVELPGTIVLVGWASDNRITNMGEVAWTKSTGMPSIWILGMFRPSPATTVVIPFVTGPESTLGPIVNDAYFGKVPDDRLVVADGVLYFKGDGEYRSKIGLSPARSKPVLGSFDDINGVLTIVTYNKPEGVTDYVNSMWEMQEAPFAGDVVNSYNDGPASPGAEPLGPFYELESSSPAAALVPGASLTHMHRTYHLLGPDADLDLVSRAVLGVGLDEIRAAFGGR